MDKFTDEQLKAIEAAFDETFGGEERGCVAATGEDWDNFLRRLTKPQPEFKEGEVAFHEPSGTYHLITPSREFDRKLTTTEAGAGELVEALDLISRRRAAEPDTIARIALDKWRQDRNE